LIEHNLDVLASADHLVDLGPEGGGGGGKVMDTGTPAEISKKARGHTGRFLAEYLDQLRGREDNDRAAG
jgi:excinuclease ABC subunit A